MTCTILQNFWSHRIALCGERADIYSELLVTENLLFGSEWDMHGHHFPLGNFYFISHNCNFIFHNYNFISHSYDFNYCNCDFLWCGYISQKQHFITFPNCHFISCGVILWYISQTQLYFSQLRLHNSQCEFIFHIYTSCDVTIYCNCDFISHCDFFSYFKLYLSIMFIIIYTEPYFSTGNAFGIFSSCKIILWI